ncbi:phosphatidylglycerophosphatase A [Dasania sp. GY-MA-18]|uniref:Phosphatidylglycerophosphatase A n=1 Tax=Dasania phycosphaerae TaxID=2950436 RepID=A0A9J6RHM1_9GAMM|nr:MULTISPECIES: phosphatidylglycerophosphatase A [Dasania]MCR8921520.1 phosphatidylglycerophosphatase A [Dasania sp. GY-MA-18]MCZ0863948.1 phosphatidylglycerophosphatase A [Dasania phycosphaerae]MCZ0867676.1 phosphatidylglycerophosphatase A [Dasania phycosphaerae]
MRVNAKAILSNPIHCLAFGFGSGLAPKAPGTFGTLMAVPLYLLLMQLPLLGYVLLLLASFIVGVYLCGKTADDLGVHDHPGIVWDEFVGFWITMLAAPAGWLWIVIGFILFRLFDIWKPWPIKVLDEKMETGLGIMLDDVLAGVYAFICLQGLVYLQVVMAA